MVNITPEFWRGRSVFLTGHTGFKGGWLALWLHQLGAIIHGYALDPPTRPSLFEAASIRSLLATDTRGDVADADRLLQAVHAARPEIIFHLAAQPLVRLSYQNPTATFMTNVMGTAHLLDAARSCDATRAIVAITTDKVYQNNEWIHPYRENDPLGGHDPYSASKTAAEIVTAAYRASFFAGPAGHPARIATARAGNVIGGGDWAADRIVPDCLRAFAARQPVLIRCPNALRPWQHVLEPLAGYLTLASKLLDERGNEFAKAWNFGPNASDNVTVGDLADDLATLWGGDASVQRDTTGGHPHEAGRLSLDSFAARHQLGWTSRYGFHHALARTVEWQQQWLQGADMLQVSLGQIEAYQNSPRP
ncbi:MAG: CDP-glucose 4,6-dehydratase [Verrucomicrobiota bacterium]